MSKNTDNCESATRPPWIRCFWTLLGAWTTLTGGLFWWDRQQSHAHMIEVVRAEARAMFEKDVLYRRWNAQYGGVYAPVDETTPPNPHLTVPERDIVTPSGRRLTLINPAYMTRLVHELGAELKGVQGHIASLKPLRPQNAADPWETIALQSFEQGAAEFSEVTPFNGRPHLRLMRPLLTEKPCLKCHEQQGYREGDVRGGISISVPLAAFETLAAAEGRQHLIIYLALWLTGLTGLGLGAWRLQAAEARRERALLDLHQAKSEVQALEGLISICCHCKQVRNDQGFWGAVETYISAHSEAKFSHGICPDCLATHYPECLEDMEEEEPPSRKPPPQDEPGT